jgi:dTDP-4-dehydrorhamnose reductase
MILLLGGSGYVGQAFQNFFQQNNIAFKNISRAEHDYTRPEILRQIIEEIKPDFLVNCAGYTGKPNVDACELHKLETLEGNVIFPGHIMQICNELQLPWGHVSSGCIYEGNSPDGQGWKETDEPNFDFRHNNCSFYSGTKALAEEILADATTCYLWRLRVPFNNIDGNRNILTKWMTYETLLDATNSLSHVDEFARACYECFEKKIPFGTDNTQVYTYKEAAATLDDLLKNIPEDVKKDIETDIQPISSNGFWLTLLINVLPMLLIVGFFLFMMRQAQTS